MHLQEMSLSDCIYLATSELVLSTQFEIKICLITISVKRQLAQKYNIIIDVEFMFSANLCLLLYVREAY